MNHAIGVLITRGRTPAEARAELRRRAGVGLNSVADVARQVLASIPGPHYLHRASSAPPEPM